MLLQKAVMSNKLDIYALLLKLCNLYTAIDSKVLLMDSLTFA
jgi:hypothetical protein